jgi:DNA helicase-2/ATP-dependent DNA helicase PcrA
MEEGILPHQRSFDDPRQMEEERRLAYVGITRAKDQLYLTRAFRRALMGSSATNPASRFLQAIPRELTTEAVRPGFAGRLADARKYEPVTRRFEPLEREAPPLPSFKDGDHVRHAKFGEGVIVATKEGGRDLEVTVAFTEAGLKRLLLSFAALERLP